MTASISRRAARECAVKALYSYEFHKGEEPTAFFTLVCTEGEMTSDDFAKSLFLGTVEHLDDVDAKIAEFAKGWNAGRLAKMTLAILRLCTYELLFTDVPNPVCINEAVELAKTYDTDAAPAFINGIVNNIAKSMSGDNQ